MGRACFVPAAALLAWALLVVFAPWAPWASAGWGWSCSLNTLSKKDKIGADASMAILLKERPSSIKLYLPEPQVFKHLAGQGCTTLHQCKLSTLLVVILIIKGMIEIVQNSKVCTDTFSCLVYFVLCSSLVHFVPCSGLLVRSPGTGIEVVVGVPIDQTHSLARSPKAAGAWLEKHIYPHLKDVNIVNLAVRTPHHDILFPIIRE